MTQGIQLDDGQPQARSARYQFLLVTLLSLNFGIVFFDRNSLNFLMPFVQDEMHLSNTQVGMLTSALSLTWAVSGLLLGRLADRTGRRKPIIVAATILFSACSFLSGIAETFALLLASRLLMGIAEGGVLPISQSLTAREVSPERRGLAMGVMQNVGSNLLGGFAAPILLVTFAAAYGWRHAFFLAGVPGMISALLIWLMIRESAPPTSPEIAAAAPPPFRDVIAARNVQLCTVIAVLLLSHFLICWTFVPLYLTRVRNVAPGMMGWLMGAIGVASAASGFIVPAISDRLGRRPVMIVVPLVGLALPLGALFYGGPTWSLAAIFFVGGMLNGASPLFLATIPSEAVDARYTATALGFIMGTGELLGGVLGPTLAGKAADSLGLSAPLWIMVGLSIGGSFVSLFLRETAPRRLLTSSRDAC